MATTQSRFGRRFDDECKREVAALACRPGATNEQVGRALGVSAWSVSRWKRPHGGSAGRNTAATTPPAAAASAGVSVAELERRIRVLERENAALREQRTILKKAVAIFTDRSASYRSRLFAQTCRELGLKHLFTRPYRPQTNGKAERFIQTVTREWAYARAYDSSDQRASFLPSYLHDHNYHRPHSALGHQPPASRRPKTADNLLTYNS